jgi:predicted MPP superfamily phosphohydrolase
MPSARPERRKLAWSLMVLPLALVAGLHLGLWMLLTLALPLAHPFSAGVGIYLALSTVAIPLGMLSMRASQPRWGAALSWVGLAALGVFSSLFVFALLRGLFLLVWAGLGEPVAGWSAQALALPSAWAVLALAGLATAVGWWIARMSPAVVEIDIPIPDLPMALHGFRIAQITDIHVGPTVRRGFLQRVVSQVNGLQADLIAITGDVVDGDVDALREHVAPLRELQARHGVALVIGNHELYSGALAWVQEFRRLGLTVLLNEHVIVRRESATLAVAGVTDHTTHRFLPELACDPHAAIAGEGEAADVRLLLAHQPLSAARGAQAGYHLALHGHTHGGQWWPWNHFVRVQQPVVKGLHRVGAMWSYTSVGTGYWGPPKRHFRREITLIKLAAAPARSAVG